MNKREIEIVERRLKITIQDIEYLKKRKEKLMKIIKDLKMTYSHTLKGGVSKETKC